MNAETLVITHDPEGKEQAIGTKKDLPKHLLDHLVNKGVVKELKPEAETKELDTDEVETKELKADKVKNK